MRRVSEKMLLVIAAMIITTILFGCKKEEDNTGISRRRPTVQKTAGG